MIRIIASVLLLSVAVSGIDWTNLHVKWNTWLLDPFRANSYFSTPLTYDDAIADGWTEIAGLNRLDLTTLCYPKDGQICIVYDAIGNIVGFQASILASDLDPLGDVYPISKFDVYTNKTIYNEKYVTSTIYTVNPATIASTASSDWDGILGTEGLWIETTAGNYLEIARTTTDLDPLWTEEACISQMGTHYYYDMHTETACEDFQPWFLLYQDGELSGVGLQAFGSCTIKSRSWCEWVPSVGIKPTIPTTPQCLIDWVADYGVISMHFYFTKNPWDVSC